MGTLKLSNSSGNFVALTPPSSIASDVTLTLPNTDGDASQFLQTDGSGTLTWATPTDTGLVYTAATPVSAGTGQYKEFTGIGSDVKRITILVNGASCDGGNYFVMQLGDSGGFETSGYTGTAYFNYASGKDFGLLSSYFYAPFASASHVVHGKITIERLNDTSFIYTSAAQLGLSDIALEAGWRGNKQLSGALTQVRVGWSGNAFDAGTLRIITEA